MLPPNILIKPWLEQWLREDLGRGDWAVQGLGSLAAQTGQAQWVAKSSGVVCGLPVAQQVFELLDSTVEWTMLVSDGEPVTAGQPLVKLQGPLGVLLTGERVALNLVMRLSGVATATRQYVDAIATFPSQFVDTRKTTPGLRVLEKYATHTGGARNHRMGLDDSVMVKDNHIAAAGGIEAAIAHIRQRMPYPLMLEVETESMAQVKTAIAAGADIIMLDNMSPEQMREAVSLIRQTAAHIKIEASGNISLETIKTVAATGVDYISSSGPITRAPWLDISMRIA
ncbi:carboxylating nicotinate-nucleotide diphosphorylase [Leptolyngbya cf. ectocarpi LEGE 11479]|uniref:Probable nicotinate-nucleotide pyrophosphorylase [carboxylating] n=1 Tax=Leptolyngbya cf. ectocarpi LEGE 11479 TaxID=1828722 RepID=A0A928X4Y0_LEPEC|nr:carboxylating nicotinate-nucleotide diphosphorylase [Leptolyngbya ectocarpi]MBE9066758.1 carboxylating nicotinate-nucleotide diphosphorylase [Leptolyngbya cf. ectocarpi LEGE 11479]